MSKQRIVVIGAGFAGLSATRMLSKSLKDKAIITLIDKHSYHTMMTQLHEVAGGRVEPEAGQYDLQKLLGKKKNVQLVTDVVTGLDKEAKIVQTHNGAYPFDYVIVAMGGEPHDFGVPGVKEHSFTLWSMEDAVKIRTHLERMVSLASIEPDQETRKAMLNFTVAGSGFTGIEMIGELIDWRAVVCKKYKFDPSEMTISVVEMMPTILNTLPRKDADKALHYLQKKGVQVLTDHTITEVCNGYIKIKDKPDMPTHTLIWTTGVQGNTEAGAFALTESERGHRLRANQYMEALGYEDKGIYVAGDISGFINEDGQITPQIVEAAEQTGHTAAANIIAAITGGEKHTFVGKYQGTLVSVGSKWGVACLMDKWHLSGFFAMFMKHIVYMMYCVQITSGYYLWQYLKNEFFHTPDQRNIGYGHISRRGNVLWSVPLRIFYGLVWLVEASHKIVGDGKYLHPSTWFGSGSWFTNEVHFPFAWLQTAATSGASEATTGASSAAATETAKSVFGLSYAYGEQPMAVFEKMPKFLEPLMKIMIPNKDVALFLQKFMSFVEIAIALCLIVGLFTWLASGATAGLTVMFCLSGMFYWVNIWFIFVAIALMNGSGRAFGLDRYVQPALQKILGKIWYGKSKARYGES